jgi:DNA polymerase-4
MTLRCLFVDLNSFFASVEQAEQPGLRGRPVGVVPVLAESTCCIAASIEAKRFGVKTGTLVREARRLCPDIAIVPARPKLYVRYHHLILDAIRRHNPSPAVGSIDEMACELIGRERHRENAIAIGQAIKDEIARVGAGGLRSSVGIAPNQFLAKTASDMRKPDGLVVIEQADLPHVLFPLDLQDLCGIGPAMLRRLQALGIHTVEQLCIASAARLRGAWGGIEGERFHARLRGVEIAMPGGGHDDDDDGRHRKSVGHSHVLAPEFRNSRSVDAVLKKLLLKAAMRLRSYGKVAGFLHVRVKYLGAEPWEAGCRLDAADDSRLLLHALSGLLANRRDRKPPLAVGVVLGGLADRIGSSGDLFSHRGENRALTEVVDRINRRYGNNRVYFGGAQEAMEAAPMRIAFNRIPRSDLEDESSNEHWLKRLRQAKVLGEAEHRRQEGRRDRHGVPRPAMPAPDEPQHRQAGNGFAREEGCPS